jgi:hypothetical protein
LFSCSPKKDALPSGEKIELVQYREVGQTSVYRADISHIPLTSIKTIIAQDSSTGGGSDGIYSGFDIDFLLLDTDGDFDTKGDQIYPLEEEETKISPGKIRNPKETLFKPTENRPGMLFGLNAGNGIDFYIATISTLDAGFDDILEPDECSGWLSLGDRGILYAHFGLKNVDRYPTMYLFIGEVGTGFEEYLNAVVRIVE